MRRCRKCGREGSRRFVRRSGRWVCESDNACAGRRGKTRRREKKEAPAGVEPAKRKPKKRAERVHLPPGFQSLRPADPVDAKDRFRQILEAIGPEAGVPFRVRSFRNSDGSVDAELLLTQFPRHVASANLFKALKAAMGGAGEDEGAMRVPGAFISGGIRYSVPEAVKSPDFRYKGLGEAASYYRRATAGGVFNTFETMFQILANMQRKRRSRPEQIFVRLHWNAEDQKPSRRPQKFKKSFPS